MTFSVIVPTHNRCDSLKKTIESIRRQDFKEFEIIVVNDGSSDGTGDYLSQLAGNSVTAIHQPNLGPARARNAGIERARGAFVAFTDDDCVVPADWLTRLHSALGAGGIDIAGGAVKNILPGVFAETSQQMTNYFVRSLANSGRPTTFLTSNNIAYRLDALRRAGGFDERFANPGGEERALHMKILDEGGKSIYLPGCIIEHAHAFSFGSFLRQQYNYGKGSFVLYRVAGRELNTPPERISSSIYLGLFGEYFREGMLKGVQKSLLTLLAQLMVTAGYIVQAAAPRTIRKDSSAARS